MASRHHQLFVLFFQLLFDSLLIETDFLVVTCLCGGGGSHFVFQKVGAHLDLDFFFVGCHVGEFARDGGLRCLTCGDTDG